ncbi:unnamed protein product [Diabrotica balteata]|uniref:Uncharacterized protein n=1 Tax=Diabrotica balteata TaxID=107213 RepID=A0A9N9SUA2_DIABA|nr:unnamed protein product [Diabrotica balteata]
MLQMRIEMFERFEKLCEEDQVEILCREVHFSNKNEQDLCYQSLIEAGPLQKRRSRLKQNTSEDEAEDVFFKPKHSVEHKSSFKFYALLREKRINICKKAFLSLHCIGEKRNLAQKVNGVSIVINDTVKSSLLDNNKFLLYYIPEIYYLRFKLDLEDPNLTLIVECELLNTTIKNPQLNGTAKTSCSCAATCA